MILHCYFKQASLKVEFKDNMTPVSAGDLAIETEIRKLVKMKALIYHVLVKNMVKPLLIQILN